VRRAGIGVSWHDQCPFVLPAGSYQRRKYRLFAAGYRVSERRKRGMDKYRRRIPGRGNEPIAFFKDGCKKSG
jgi:hypothetical protein